MVAIEPSPLRVRLLGGLGVEGLTAPELGSRKARSLIKVLALARGAPVPIATLADVLWGDDLPARPADQVGVLVSRLRGVLGRERLVRSDAGFSLAIDWLDVDELADRVEEASAALRESRFAAARAAATASLALVRGPLLPDDDGMWLQGERARTDVLVARARGVAAMAALAAGDHVAAELAAEAALAQDPYDEVALRVLMRAQVGAGRPAAALASYARARARLAEDLGVSPHPETEALHTAVVTGPSGHVGVQAPLEPAGGIVGRDEEMAVLRRHLAAARRGRVHLVVIEGEAGIGKTALVEHFAHEVRAGGDHVVMAVADELGRDLPLQPVLDALGRGRGADAGPGPAALTSWPAPDVTVMPDSDAERTAWYATVLAAVGGPGVGLAAGPTTVVAVEDVHHADAATRAWLTWAPRRPGSVLLLATSRPGPTLAGGHRLVLDPLDAQAVGDLIGGLVDGDRRAEVHERSGGNPLFALALAAAPPGELPVTVREAVESTVAGLDATTAEVVRGAAVLGADIDVDLVAAVLRAPAVEVIGKLEDALAAGLLVERGHGFGFRHAVVREALEVSTGAARRALLHREAARVLDERPERDPLAVAVHARLGGAVDIAGPAFVEAAAVSLARADVEAAERHLRAALLGRETAAAHEALARVLMVAQRLEEAAAEAERAVALGGGPSALEVAGWVNYYGRRHHEAQLFADEAVLRAEPRSAVRASGLALGGRVRHSSGDIGGADERLAGALDGPPGVRGVAEVWLGQVRNHEGRPLDALELIERALVDPDHLSHPFAGLHGRFGRAHALGQLGRVADALRACDELDRSIERGGPAEVRFRAVACNVRAWVLRGSGRGAEADALNEEAVERNGAADGSGPSSEGFAEAYWVALLDLADGRLAAGDPAGAERILERLAAIDGWTGTMAWHQRHRLGLLRARLMRAGGDPAHASHLAAEVAADAEHRGAGRYAALARAQLALSGGEGDLERIDRAMEALGACAGLEGWSLAAELADRFGLARWRVQASRWAADLVAACPPEGAQAVRAMVAPVMDR